MKTKLALLLIFFSFVGMWVFQACSAGGGGGGGSPAGGSTATITVLQPPIVVAKNTDGSSGEVNVGVPSTRHADLREVKRRPRAVGSGSR